MSQFLTGMSDQMYASQYLQPLCTSIVQELLSNKPHDIVGFVIDFLKIKTGRKLSSSEQDELKKLRSQVQKLKQLQKESEGEESEEDEEEEELSHNRASKIEGRTAISAEVYGEWNKKENFVPRVIPKDEQQKNRLREKLKNSFIFNSLEENDQKVIIDAFEMRNIPAKKTVINQAEDGSEVFLVDSGTLDCFKQFSGEPKPRKLKVYEAGDVFGELALLYNAPRAATVIAVTDCVLWALDRGSFNNIVKDATSKRRQKYEEIVQHIPLLQDMDPYERIQLTDAFVSCKFNTGEYVMKEGDVGNDFFIIVEGNAEATKVLQAGKQPQKVKNYAAGDYFGELALLKGEPRAANVIATTELKCVKIDRHSFKRMLGPVEGILKRNAENYQKFISQ